MLASTVLIKIWIFKQGKEILLALTAAKGNEDSAKSPYMVCVRVIRLHFVYKWLEDSCVGPNQESAPVAKYLVAKRTLLSYKSI